MVSVELGTVDQKIRRVPYVNALAACTKRAHPRLGPPLDGPTQ